MEYIINSIQEKDEIHEHIMEKSGIAFVSISFFKKDCHVSIEDDKSHYFDIKISSPLCSEEDIMKNPPKVTSAYIPSSVSHPSRYQRFGMECIDAMV